MLAPKASAITVMLAGHGFGYFYFGGFYGYTFSGY
jgi:hypothetical protein